MNVYENVKHELVTAADRMNERYDASRKVGPSKLKCGDWVWIQTPPAIKIKCFPSGIVRIWLPQSI